MGKYSQAAQRRFRRVGSGTSVCLRARLPRVGRLPRAPQLRRAAKLRLQMMDYRRHHSVSATARHFGFARTTVYRWQRRYDPTNLISLENRSFRPRRVRARTWTEAQVAAVRAARAAQPRWGKDKLAVVLRRQGMALSVSMIGRILTDLKRRQVLVEAPLPRRRPPARQRRPYAVRKPMDVVATQPGHLVEVDTMELRPLPGVVRHQFTAVDVVSRYSVVGVRAAATAGTATAFLTELLARLPVPVRAIQVDGGSEFMAGFEAACQERGIALYALPPRSPKLNGHVERANGTSRREFWECYAGDLALPSLSDALRAWEDEYNHARPHQALGYQTPAEFLAAHQQGHL